ncbi:MAG: sugar ABC transporter permease [Candidatus Hadarchaeum sp.]|uniref:carbohydrate ABC transporter permease n=1 Tax=Candidatus Hadarchaeum sp. TaxID=2883567 RepID=UPI0031807DD2
MKTARPYRHYRIPWYLTGVFPFTLLLCIVLLVPTVWTLFISLHNWRFGYPMRFTGLSNYRAVLSDPWFWRSVRITLIFTVSTVLAEFALGLSFALILLQKFPFRKLWIALLLSPYAISPVVAAASWKYLLNPAGMVNYLLSFLKLPPVPWLSNSAVALISLCITNVWLSYPFIMLIAYSAISSLPLEMFEAPLVDGASYWQRFRYVTFPLISPALLIAIVFRLIIALRTFDIVWLMTQGGPVRATELLGIQLYRVGFRYWQFGTGSAIAWMIFLMTLCIAIPYIKLTYRRVT